MAGSRARRDNIVFLPQTVMYYEEMLAEALQTERYAQAVQMLNGMLSMQLIDINKRREWDRLLQGLLTMFPELKSADPDASENEDDAGEELFRMAAFSRKMHEDPGYADRLLLQLQKPQESDRVDDHLLVLEQLAYAESSRTDGTIVEWLSARERHPLLQYRALQTLKQRGMQGDVPMVRNGKACVVSLADIPVGEEDMPESIKAIFALLLSECEAKYPTLRSFLPEIERDFLAFTIGTALYQGMREANDPLTARMWAAALHAGLLQHIFHSENVLEIYKEYEIPDEHLHDWHRIFAALEQVFGEMFKGRV